MRLLLSDNTPCTDSAHAPLRRSVTRGAAIGALCVGIAVLSGCASKPQPGSETSAGLTVVSKGRLFGFLSPYRIDIQQGNFVSREMVAQLRPGMSRDQVRFVMGTPLQVDIFHADRWDYDFRLAKGNGELITSRVTVFFNGSVMDRYEGGTDLPTEAEYLALIAASKPGSVPASSSVLPGAGPNAAPATPPADK